MKREEDHHPKLTMRLLSTRQRRVTLNENASESVLVVDQNGAGNGEGFRVVSVELGIHAWMLQHPQRGDHSILNGNCLKALASYDLHRKLSYLNGRLYRVMEFFCHARLGHKCHGSRRLEPAYHIQDSAR